MSRRVKRLLSGALVFWGGFLGISGLVLADWSSIIGALGAWILAYALWRWSE